MHSPHKYDLQTAASGARNEGAIDSELNFRSGVIRMRPHGLPGQDEHGRLLLVNDAETAQLGIGAGEPSSRELELRREAAAELLRARHPATVEECSSSGAARQVFLTSHRPVRIANRDLLLSSSADITEQKAFEEELFRQAYYDELTGLPSRRGIEHRVNKLLHHQEAGAGFALGFLDIDNFKHINDYYGHAGGDTLLVESTQKVCT